MDPFAVYGGGEIGAKARGLFIGREVLAEAGLASRLFAGLEIGIPALIAVSTDAFERFLDENGLARFTAGGEPPDDELVRSFAAASLPDGAVQALEGWLERHRGPLAVRSSSVLEDAAEDPFAGVYSTLMVASRGSPATRLEEACAAVKRVYASAFARSARRYRASSGRLDRDEKMGVVVQLAAGRERNDRFYPHISGVARSYNFYAAGLARPDDGVVELALGLGRTIVEEGLAWRCSPAQPHANPPYGAPIDLVEQTQKSFWAIDLASGGDCRAGRWADGLERGAMRRYTLAEAEADGALTFLASTYSADDDRIVSGLALPGPRVLDFAPILKARRIPLVPLVVDLLGLLRIAIGRPVEIEFAMTFGEPGPLPARFDLLQVRPMAAAYPEVEVPVVDLPRARVLAASDRVMGNGIVRTIRDIVYVKPSAFEPRHGAEIVEALEAENQALVASGRPYLLIGFGRWGTTDASAGIPADFGQIAGARAIVEATLPQFDVMASHGSHFFHNIASRRVLYFSVGHGEPYEVDWPWLDAQQAAGESRFARHVVLPAPLDIMVDGRIGRGLIVKPG
ncbi:MAG: PEP/pyruvate-binding domain-containing protein [Vicinamibacterales bacterium]